jgi:hypothetical protein
MKKVEILFITLVLLIGVIETGFLTSSSSPTTAFGDTDEKMSIQEPENMKTSRDYEIGEILWQYTITGGWDNSPQAIVPISDINSDGIGDVIVCSEEEHVRCFDGSAISTGNVLWEHDAEADVFCQNGLCIMQDIDNDGCQEVVIGTSGGTYNGRMIRTISGGNGNTIWTHDTHEYGGGGWVYQVNCGYDYNNDGINDVLAAVGNDGTNTGPRRVYCLDALTGESIWECFIGGAVFSVMGIEDFTSDGYPDVIAGTTNGAQTVGYAYGINGASGGIEWIYTPPGPSVWALEQIDDITNDGIKDVIIGDYYGNIYGLDSTNGNVIYSNALGSSALIIERFEKINDVNGDGHPDIVPAHLGSGSIGVKVIDGQTGQFIWEHPVYDKPAVVDKIEDISGDGINDILVGTLYVNNYCYFLNGTNGNELEVIAYGEAVDSISAIPDVTGDGSMEMMAGGRDGLVTCFSGGLNASLNTPPHTPSLTGPIQGTTGVPYNYTVVTTDVDTDDVFYYIEWGDGTPGEWLGPFSQGVPCNISHIWLNPGLYTIKAKAKDIHNAESNWSEALLMDITNFFTMPLYTNWNLITVPRANMWTAETLGQNISDCTTICRFNADSQTYTTYVVDIPYNDFPILDGVGYFVYVTQESYLNVTGLSITSVNVSLSSPWNIIGWYKETATNASSLGAALHDCTTICLYNATTGSYTTHVIGVPYNDFPITMGMGLFIYVTSDSYWTGE